MKIKLFYQKHKQSLEEFENQVNNFMADVEVVDVKYTEATSGDYENLDTLTGLLVLYK
ncbi:sporulation protein Cse60 [Streptococcus hillyeri]|uniref:Sporulation protein Cse60 n=1 Tax=Streptococcus hillyeri TaxID=2282420 RepID=A0A3L9DTQ4_9STRE|nr:sporulation protein Cse60 [Streptococcus hillyeri]RLY03403.1 sporulation protein Cse60 [Streptococcus hillyeri]